MSVFAAFQPSQIERERRAYRRERRNKSLLGSLLSTLAFATLIWLGLANSPGWASVQESFFSVEVLRLSFAPIAVAFWLNIKVLFFATIGVAVLGSAIAFLRTLRGGVFLPVRVLAAAYTDLFRGVPLILVLYLVGYGIPGLNVTERIPAAVYGTIALILTYGAYVAEVLRAGIDAVHPSQWLAARSLGLSHQRSLRLVILPQAIRNVTPALMNDFVALQKDVGLISILGAVDAVRRAQILSGQLFNFTPYVVAGLLFVLLSWPMIRVTDWYTARVQRKQQMGGLV